MTTPPRTPCIIGVGQALARPEHDGVTEPLELWACATERAFTDSGGSRLAEHLDDIRVTFCHSWPYDDGARRLADRIGASSQRVTNSGMGGSSGQTQVVAAANGLAAGAGDLALVCGGEALASLRWLHAHDLKPTWSHRAPATGGPPSAHGHAGELAVGMIANVPLSFALFDTARRAARGESVARYTTELGQLLAPMTHVAAANPYAWFPTSRTAGFITGPRPDNRPVAHPYTKHMVAMLDVDLAAAVVIATHRKADELGIPPAHRVYLHGAAHASDEPVVAARPSIAASPGMARSASRALQRAGITIGDVTYLDLYSCFPSAINLARDALGIEDRSGDQLTVTGGLPYAGGPGSSYTLHAIAAMAGVLRSDEGAFGMVSGLGMLMSSHVHAVYSTTPPGGPVDLGLDDPAPTVPAVEVSGGYGGPACVAAYSIARDRAGVPSGVAICDLPDGSRSYARIADERLAGEAEADEFVGEKVQLVAAGACSVIGGN